ncbi:MAG: hypothetical protein H7326_11440 [Bdellovibrionaceae bacterium]|nr:hypothetical protein [Pseudobdellovibrionaceae bacterium]
MVGRIFRNRRRIDPGLCRLKNSNGAGFALMIGMRPLHDKQDFYEVRPLLLIVLGFVGIFNSYFTNSTPGMVRFGQVCGVLLFFSAFKIIRWRMAYRKRFH